MKRGVLLLVLALLVFPAAAAWSCLVCTDLVGTWRGTYEGTNCAPPDGDDEPFSGHWVVQINPDCSGTFYSVETGEVLFQAEFCGDTFTATGEDEFCGEVSAEGTVSDDTISGVFTFELGGGGSFQGRRVTDIPALSEWGMAALGLMLALCAVLFLRRRRMTLERP
jgi:hypothetical protein